MNFQSETVRILYHQIPADKQLALLKAEELLASAGIQLDINDVKLDEAAGMLSPMSCQVSLSALFYVNKDTLARLSRSLD